MFHLLDFVGRLQLQLKNKTTYNQTMKPIEKSPLMQIISESRCNVTWYGHLVSPLVFKDKMADDETSPYFILQQIHDYTEFKGHSFHKIVMVSYKFGCDYFEFVINGLSL